jgi:hypothetical protein
MCDFDVIQIISSRLHDVASNINVEAMFTSNKMTQPYRYEIQMHYFCLSCLSSQGVTTTCEAECSAKSSTVGLDGSLPGKAMHELMAV